MAPSPQYQSLVSQHSKLRSHLLPKTLNPTGNYPDRIRTATLAYRVLSHAEIESYLEDRALEVALEAMKAWQHKRRSSKTLLGLLAFSGQDIESPPNSLDLSQPKPSASWEDRITLSHRIQAAMNRFAYSVKINHGIKETNIRSLLLPIGVEFPDLDPILIADLNSFAEQRGEAAHSSSRNYLTKQQIDPQVELTRIESIIGRLLVIDQAIDQLLLEVS